MLYLWPLFGQHSVDWLLPYQHPPLWELFKFRWVQHSTATQPRWTSLLQEHERLVHSEVETTLYFLSLFSFLSFLSLLFLLFYVSPFSFSYFPFLFLTYYYVFWYFTIHTEMTYSLLLWVLSVNKPMSAPILYFHLAGIYTYTDDTHVYIFFIC